MPSSALMTDRIRMPELRDHLLTAEQAAEYIINGMTIGISGFTRAGDPKVVPLALAKRVQQSEEKIKIQLWSGASVAEEVDHVLTDAGIIARRLPFQSDKTLRNAINNGQIHFIDQHLSMVSEKLRDGHIEPIDLAIIEAVAIRENGGIVPTTSVGNSAIFALQAKRIIVELNLAQPIELDGVHDIHLTENRPHRKPIAIGQPSDRIGLPYIPIDPDKIIGIVISNQPDHSHPILPPQADTQMIAHHLLDFLEKEVAVGRMSEPLPPIQSGIGCVANAVLDGLLHSRFRDLEMYSEVLQDAVFDLIDAGKVKFASSCSITLSPNRSVEVLANFDRYKPFILLRPQEISNHPEVIRRLGLIAINTAIEIDLYGHVNSTHVMGTQMMNGIGGSGDFARNAFLSVFVTPSIAKGGKISCIVPMVSHVDHTEHDVDIVITEQGLADLRGLDPRERAEAILSNCVHPDYRGILSDYYEEALRLGGHIPHQLSKAFALHTKFLETGTMK